MCEVEQDAWGIYSILYLLQLEIRLVIWIRPVKLMASTYAPDFSINSDSAASLFGRFATGGYFVPVPDFSDTLNHSLDAASIDAACVNTLDTSLFSYDETSEMNDMLFPENTYESATAPKWS